MADRRLIITVPDAEYKRLARQARQDVRSPEQQAAFLVRKHVSEASSAEGDRRPAEAQVS